MKKRLLSLFLVLAMLCAMTIGASAATKSGTIQGGIRDIPTRATLQMSATGASASTSCNEPDLVSFETSVYFYYYSAPGVTSNVYNSGSSSTSIYADNVMNATSARWADSHHRVNGGVYGSWECSLRDYGPAY